MSIRRGNGSCLSNLGLTRLCCTCQPGLSEMLAKDEALAVTEGDVLGLIMSFEGKSMGFEATYPPGPVTMSHVI